VFLATVLTRVLTGTGFATTPRLPYIGVRSLDVGSLRTGPYRIGNRRTSIDHDRRRIVNVVRCHLNGNRGRKRRGKNRDPRGRSRCRKIVGNHCDRIRANVDRYVRHTSTKANEKVR
jgi:hypothetical protein